MEPLFKGTTVYLASVMACALKSAGEIASNRGLESDGEKFAQAKPHAEDSEGRGNPVRAPDHGSMGVASPSCRLLSGVGRGRGCSGSCCCIPRPFGVV